MVIFSKKKKRWGLPLTWFSSKFIQIWIVDPDPNVKRFFRITHEQGVCALLGTTGFLYKPQYNIALMYPMLQFA